MCFGIFHGCVYVKRHCLGVFHDVGLQLATADQVVFAMFARVLGYIWSVTAGRKPVLGCFKLCWRWRMCFGLFQVVLEVEG